MLIAKISFYFESAKKTGEKFREKLGFQNHCPHPYHPPNRYQDTMKGLYATFSSCHIDPCRFPFKCGLIYVAEHLILLPSLGVKQSTLLFNSISTRYGLKFIPKEFFAVMFVTTTIIYNNISSPTIPTFCGFATIHNFLVF